ncbi:MAG: PilZ domain-containing protein [Candidatus Korobacteraceae bacterium]
MFIKIPVEVLGTELTGMDFFDKAVTDSVSRHGAGILIARPLGPDQEIMIKLEHGREAAVRVIGHIGDHNDGFIYGITFIEDQQDFWGIEFHDIGIATAGRVLLECLACHRKIDFGLDVIDLAVFEAKERIRRSCSNCHDHTFWGPVHSSGATLEIPSETLPALPPSPSKLLDRRRNRRLHIQKAACIRQHFQTEEIANTLDVSHTGLRFRSRRSYQPDSWVEVAMPYIQGGANIFVPARIAWMKSESDLNEYGVEYQTFPGQI